MAAMIPATSDIPFFSSLHGERRRAERVIDRRDLQAAVKYGKKQRAKRDPRTGALRWKYTFADIIYITDDTSTQEITSWVAPIGIPLANLTLNQIGEHEAAKERLKNDPSRCTSHTVIVVDQSGSMRETDVANFYNRSQAVFGMLALDFVAKPRLSGEAGDTDVVSLVLMQNRARIVLEREPTGLVLYNQLVGLHDVATPGSHGNFLPALDLAEQLLKKHRHAECALSLLFLTDGSPSDFTTYLRAGKNPGDVTGDILDRVRALADTLGEQLSVVTVGFAGPEQDFSVLEAMAQAARDGGAQGKFLRPEMSSRGLGTAIADSVSSLTATRLRLTTLAGESQPRELRHVEREAAGARWGYAPTTARTGDGWVVYTNDVRSYRFSPEAKKFNKKNPWIRVALLSKEADGIAIRSKALGEGAERLVFGLQELDLSSGFVGPKMVAKESRHVGEQNRKIGFHYSFAMTQLTAQRIATKFNGRVRQRLSMLFPRGGAPRVWDVTFLPCSVYTFFDGGFERSVLVEKKLVGRYTKFNGNNGYLNEAAVAAAARADQAAGSHDRQRTDEAYMLAIDEGNEEDSDDDDDASRISGGNDAIDARVEAAIAVSGSEATGACPLATFNPEPESYVQAFSHFSYRSTNRKMLVCDLQGVQSTSTVGEDHAGVFELTDPVIHYRSKFRSQVYGRTDLGTKGMHRFFETHRCNDVCRLLGLSN